MHRLVINNVSKRFGARKVFDGISADLKTGGSLAIIGPNGSGKSTLVRCLLGLYRPTKGTIEYFEDDRKLSGDEFRNRTAFVSPYLNLYSQLTGEENIKFFATMRGVNVTGKQINAMLARVGLEGRGDDLLSEYSSGMGQRLKYAVALLSEPEYLFLDEPTSNLDEPGKQIVFDVVNEYRRRAIVVIATNEKEEYALAESQCRVGQ